MVVYNGINTKELMAGRRGRRCRMEAGEKGSLKPSHLIYMPGGLKVIQVYTDKQGVGWVWDSEREYYLRVSVYLPYIFLSKKEDGDL